MSFIQGGAGINPEVWAALNGDYAPGRYTVDLSLNGEGYREADHGRNTTGQRSAVSVRSVAGKGRDLCQRGVLP